jgi:CRP/FNR family nitrogen fixation transcriptional regulator
MTAARLPIAQPQREIAVTTQRLNIDRTTAVPAFEAAQIPCGVRMQFAAGEEIYAQEEEADLVYQLVSGAVRTTRLLADGRRHIGDFYYPGDLFGIEAGAEHRFSAEALGDCEVMVVKRGALRLYGAEGERLERMIWDATAHQLERTQDHLMLLGRKTACEKVASFLLDLADRFGGDITTLPMGRQDMADYLGLTIETVSRMLTQLQSDGLVEFCACRRFRILRRGALARLVAN